MKRVVLSLWTLALATPAWAVRSTGFIGDDLATGAYNSIVGVWIPLIALFLIFSVVIALLAGYGRQLGGKVIAAIFAVLILGGGIPYLNTISGGTIATSVTLPTEEACL